MHFGERYVRYVVSLFYFGGLIMNCQICGKTSGYLPLCKSCLKLKNDGKVIKCPICGTWRKTDDYCPECNNDPIKVINSTDNHKNELLSVNTEKNCPELTCLICGENSSGLHFCKKCYAKYKNRSIDLRITNCIETEILDEYGNLTYKCDDGRKVRSRAEAIICSWLYNNKIRVKYEEPVYYRDEKGETKELHPDFYLPDYDTFIEYNELTNPKYVKSKEYTQKIYDKLGIKVIIMTDKDLQDISACLKPKLFIR